MHKIWKIKEPNSQLQIKLSDALGIHPIVAQLLINREIFDVKEAEIFLSADISGLVNPFLFKHMDIAVDRIRKAQHNRERVLIFGDYDVDGVTSCVLLYNLLTQMGIEVLTHIPNRMHDGYGLNHEIGDYARHKGVSLLIAVDCGITANREVETLNQLGLDVIIIDHHEPSESGLPKALAIINPKQKDCPYPFKHLASVGLVTKLIQAVLGEFYHEALALAAIGTIADVVPLRGENRILVKFGLPNISKTKNKGLQALLETAKIKDKKISPFHVGFVLGPRINAAGRMDSAHKSLELFLCEDPLQALILAQALEQLNIDRQKMQRDVVQEALEIVEQEVNFKDHKVIVLSKEGWHKGVLGIVASKITEMFYRPSIVISVKDGIGTASARSIDGFHLHDALSHCADFLEDFGGHQGAAGLTIRQENIDTFRSLINEVAQETLEIRRLIPAVSIDCEIPLSAISLELADVVDAMEPFGEGNPTPVFCSRSLTVKSRPQVLGKDTLKFWVSDGKFSISAVGFGMAKYKEMVNLGQTVDLAYEIAIDDWNKAPTPQLKLKDIRPGGS
ncbi:MAG TPA: single-stranded-DNA-specific exonuclease RecJ [Candidatus Omnitrophica bacterium]|nr:MAG: single-stranded-DNA-specific exonuclease RecJ [Omnitrophica WOR_2 bacterium GWA2_45_18]OGX21071.1 MAG: single-stranded-DNA-specific exonuclease RecJ [Omnitrophica WOR_2 bacterium GWC2_45_7]HBR13934.1 single-stranded-DNA-specific exonuclease RecJ [Candidatus Omnitrophota bacterium]